MRSSSPARNSVAIALLVAAVTLVARPLAAQQVGGETPAERLITIASGRIGGVYYPAAAAICRLVNAERNRHGIICITRSSDGSLENVELLRDDVVPFALISSDWHSHAYRGTSRYSEGRPFTDLRSVFSLHTEPFTVVAAADSGIERFEDLVGRNVDIGAADSGQRGTMDVVLNAYGWTLESFGATREQALQAQSDGLCSGAVDAFINTFGHPNAVLRETAERCPIRLVPVVGPEVDTLIAENPFYTRAVIPAGEYIGIVEPVETFGVRATLVTRARLEARIVEEVTRAVFDFLGGFKSQHPALADLQPSEMATVSLTAPVHEAARAYYREEGLIE